MSYNSFLSLVLLITEDRDLGRRISELARSLEGSFSSFEIILINNGGLSRPKDQLEVLDADTRENLVLLNLARREDRSIALVAGMDFANGDYVLVADTDFLHHPAHIVQDAYLKAQEGFDIVVLSKPRSAESWLEGGLLWVVGHLLRRWGDIDLRLSHEDWRLVARRALNHILSIRDSRRSMKAVFAYVGFPSTFVELPPSDAPPTQRRAPSDELRSAIYALTTFTDGLSICIGWAVVLSVLLGVGAGANAVSVRWFGYDLFLQPQEQVPGWAFLVVFQSTMFSLLFGILYILSLYLTAINAEVRKKPLYFLESVTRF